MKFTPGSTTGTVIYTGSGATTGLYVISDGTLYFADLDNSVVRKSINATGNGIIVAGVEDVPAGAPDHFNYPYGVYAENSGTFYVADAVNNVVLKFFSNSTSGTNGTIVA
ncbi:unnamed protein product, partial [Didymodactylos carnosus]